MTKLAVIYYSSTGTVDEMARRIAAELQALDHLTERVLRVAGALAS